MSEDYFGFCPHCGENLKSDAVYCPACGSILKSDAPGASQYYDGKRPMKGAFLVAFVLLIIYCIFELIGAGSLLTFNSATYDEIDQMFVEVYGKTFAEYMSDLGMEFTKEEFLNESMILGVTGVISAIAAGVSAFFCYKRSNFMIAVGACGVATLIAVIGGFMTPLMSGAMGAIPTLIVGGIVTYLIYKSKDYFETA